MNLDIPLARWIQRVVLLWSLVLGFQFEGHLVAQAPPPPTQVPPNASLITANVLRYSVWPPGSLKGKSPIIPPDQTLYSLTVEIQTAEPANPIKESLAVPTPILEVFSTEKLSLDLVGKRIKAIARLTGDTNGVRWLISNVSVSN